MVFASLSLACSEGRYMKNSQMLPSCKWLTAASLGRATLFAALAAILPVSIAAKADATPTRSTTIALTSDETRVVVVNREANSVSIIQVKDAGGNDVANKLVEIGVGEEPRCVAVHPSDRAAYVTNAISGTVSVIDLVLG